MRTGFAVGYRPPTDEYHSIWPALDLARQYGRWCETAALARSPEDRVNARRECTRIYNKLAARLQKDIDRLHALEDGAA